MITLLLDYEIKTIESWFRKYSAFENRLSQVDIYLSIFNQCLLALMTQQHQPFDSITYRLFQFVCFLNPYFLNRYPVSNRHPVLNQYHFSDIYRACLQLETLEKDKTFSPIVECFYPPCLAALQSFVSGKLPTRGDYSNKLQEDAENLLATKIKEGKTSDKKSAWRYAITSPEFDISLFLILSSVFILTASIALSWPILGAISLVFLVVGGGILAAPFCTTLYHRLTASKKNAVFDLPDLPQNDRNIPRNDRVKSIELDKKFTLLPNHQTSTSFAPQQKDSTTIPSVFHQTNDTSSSSYSETLSASGSEQPKYR